MLIINDLHIGVTRQGGTTPQSQQALRDHLRGKVTELITTEWNEVTVNGDLFDGFTVDVLEVVRTYEMFADWLHTTGGTLNLIAGNHDWNPRGDKLSSFHLLCHFLKSHFGEKVRVFDDGFAHVSGNICCIPHMPNQELFNIEIDKAIENGGDGGWLLLHCNYKNTFAENSDHSLNLNDDQIGKLIVAGWKLVLGHEHQGYELRGGRVIVAGNQFPTSISDCIGEKGKRCLRTNGDDMEFVKTWSPAGEYVEVDWRDMSIGDADFIRVVGEASAVEAADVISAISKLRQQANAFVITNAVKIAGNEAMADMAEVSLENVKAYDVIAAIMEQLDEREAEVVKGLMA
jgi:DNA repair exonuclease SbcCD nuclease subunit